MSSVCAWVPENDPLYRRYHDEEWGVPVRDDRVLFEFLVLESAQAGLSWKTVLHKRENYRRAFAGFDPERVASFGDADVERLMADAGIIRNGAKIRAAISNARLFLDIASEHGTFARYLWAFVGGNTIDGNRASVRELPAVTPESEAMARDLKARGFKFFGPTVCYAHMQATGLVNDHTLDCFRHEEVSRRSSRSSSA
ncbi:DNA-3-methyladenine glycosylase I [bacterium]|nr:DNA-3-methyladenine glycosylase I [bacterium]